MTVPVPAVVYIEQTFQNHTAKWWAARAVKARRDANRRAQVIRELRKRLARHLQAHESLRVYAGDCLAAIIDRENPGWDPKRWNTAGSGAYGLPQALPAEKMASAGADWRTNPYTQIRWAKAYARTRYGGECQAWAHWQAYSQW